MSAYVEYGIDLGTTNARIGRWDGQGVRLLTRRAALSDPANSAAGFKQQIGEGIPYRFPGAKKSLSPEALAAAVIKSLVEDVRQQGGQSVPTAVIAVPAAFGALQCEAISRAAQVAGLEQPPLLQEPIAAAIGYGVTPGSSEERLMLVDLGGGTLDVLILSTRDRRLRVVEPRASYPLGGQEIDRLIVEQLLIPKLEGRFALPAPRLHRDLYQTLHRRLLVHAEEAKIALTAADEVNVRLTGLGADLRGRPIGMAINLKRVDLEMAMQPILERCTEQVDLALRESRMLRGDLDRLLLVGGATQMPVIQRCLQAHLGIIAEQSADPLGVVARGAAIYAATAQRVSRGPSASRLAGRVAVHLEYARASLSPTALVVGRIEPPNRSQVSAIKVDAVGGHWTSGWVPVTEGAFEWTVALLEARLSAFRITARDRDGHSLAVEPATFAIHHHLAGAASHLRHAICLEIEMADGRRQIEELFAAGRPLPVEQSWVYHAARTLRLSDPDASLAIKLWEGGGATDPGADRWVGNVHIRSSAIRRPIPAGARVDLTVAIDQARMVTVVAYVPHLHERFTNTFYLPQGDEAPVEAMACDPVGRPSMWATEAVEAAQKGLHVVDRFGSLPDREDFERLRHELNVALVQGDPQGARQNTAALNRLRWQILREQPWFWEQWFLLLGRPGTPYINPVEAKRWIAQGERASQAGSLAEVKEAVWHLVRLQPPEAEQAARECALSPGLGRA